MLDIKGYEIHLTRADTVELLFPAIQVNEDGTEEPYEFQLEDEVFFRLSAAAGSRPVLIEKKCSIDYENNAAVLYLEPADTESLRFGVYRYEVELVAGSEHYTYYEDQPFEIGREVEHHE